MKSFIILDVRIHTSLIDIIPIKMGDYVLSILILQDWAINEPNEYKVKYVY